MATAVIDTQPVEISHQVAAEPNWWWDYAETKAPDNNEMYYFKYTIFAITFYFTLHLICHLLCYRNTQIYRDMNTVKRTEYRSYIISIIHAIGAVFLATISMWYICGDGKTVFNNDQCMDTVRYVHIWALLHTCGYFISDFFWLFFVIKGDSTLDYQTYAHHLIAVFTFYQTLYFMDFMVVFGVMLLFIEISTPFVSFRWLLFTHGMQTSKLYAANAILVFVSFLTGRLLYQFYIVFWFGIDWIYAEYCKKNITLYQATVITEMVAMVVLSVILNGYWFMLMVKMIMRVISRSFAPKPADPEEKIELVKADGLALDNEAECGSSTQGSNAGEIAEENQNDPEVQNQNMNALGMDI